MDNKGIFASVFIQFLQSYTITTFLLLPLKSCIISDIYQLSLLRLLTTRVYKPWFTPAAWFYPEPKTAERMLNLFAGNGICFNYWVEWWFIRFLWFLWIEDNYMCWKMICMLMRWCVICCWVIHWWDDDRYGDLRRVVVVLWIADVWCVDDYGELTLE